MNITPAYTSMNDATALIQISKRNLKILIILKSIISLICLIIFGLSLSPFFIVVGLVYLIISVIGCLGISKESKVLLITYIVFSFLLLVLCLIFIILTIVSIVAYESDPDCGNDYSGMCGVAIYFLVVFLIILIGLCSISLLNVIISHRLYKELKEANRFS
jgi:hypothetical protein